MRHTLAQITNPVLPSGLGNAGAGSGGRVVGGIISGVVGAIFVIAFLLTLIYLFLGGIEWLGSGGDKTHLENARDKITHAITGLVIVGAAWAITVLVGQFFGLSVTNLPIPSVTQ
ncbi:hypothetical protein HY086_00640 [Candidatus Gottesmanbacteria bacterium]|nr:hypothetical protein [Candidatus Gottesmanbacteria bacterium]